MQPFFVPPSPPLKNRHQNSRTEKPVYPHSATNKKNEKHGRHTRHTNTILSAILADKIGHGFLILTKPMPINSKVEKQQSATAHVLTTKQKAFLFRKNVT